jgi:hypothetical protein
MNMSFFYFIGNFDEIPYEIKKPSGQDRTAAEREYVAEATHCCGESYKVGFFLTKNHDKRVKSCYNKNKKRRARICV